MTNLKGKTLFITGASRGVGLAIAKRAARDGARIAVLGKTTTPHPKLPGTIYTAAKDIEALGGEALPLRVDIREDDQVAEAVEKTIERFGGIDILINNASAIQLTGTAETAMKRFDLMHQVIPRASFLCAKLCLPHLEKAENPHILNIAPPINLDPKWFKDHVAYTVAKYSSSMLVLGMAEEFREKGIAVNALWPATILETAAVRNLLGGEAAIRRSRKPEIMADAAHALLVRGVDRTGGFYTDEQVLAEEGITDWDEYALEPGASLIPDIFL